MIKKFLSWLRGDHIVTRAQPSTPSPPSPIVPAKDESLINTTLVSMSAEDTARWINQPQSEPWLGHAQGEFKRRTIAQQGPLKEATFESLELFAKACEGHSDITAARLRDLTTRGRAGDERAFTLAMAMMGELINTAFTEVK